MPASKIKPYEYRCQLLENTTENEFHLRKPQWWPRKPKHRWGHWIGGALLVVSWTALIAVVAFVSGQKSASPALASPNNVSIKLNVFRYNRTFGEVPSESSDRAWASIFPSRGTFFTEATIEPQRGTLSVFHQLHCVDEIRHSYWAMLEAARSGRVLVESELPSMSRPPHIRHCLDLLRQSLMCHADTTIEVVDKAAGGVHGFGAEHRCRDWNELIAQVDRWHDDELTAL